MTYTHMAVGDGPNTFGVTAVVEWHPIEGGYRVSLLDANGELHTAATRELDHLPEDPGPAGLNRAVLRAFGDLRRLIGDRDDWWTEAPCVAYELADHDDFVWFACCTVDRRTRDLIERLGA
ncbi:hypothetical protein DR950_36025 [Kitasatospora xanthocidica]|uniref:Uncharacterized protein n=1 Tax=Kitasatospora xanthocidica TaxID=83382 RepID=A0A373A4T7_9ACTN|nr:hypothetical protein [Kitasatospora xanthocidica]RGD62445.1 hypothetical protein DR950_36025 [Kitasatospora xanthocidica]